MSTAVPPSFTALLLLAHGSPEPGWSAPFEAIRDLVRELHAGGTVALGFLPPATPDFMQAMEALVLGGARCVRIVPLFLARGGHVNRDLPAMAEAARARWGIEVTVAEVLGESAVLREAIAQWAAGHGAKGA